MSTILADNRTLTTPDYRLTPLDEEDERKPNAELLQTMEDVRLRRNLYGPFATAEEAVRSMLED